MRRAFFAQLAVTVVKQIIYVGLDFLGKLYERLRMLGEGNAH